MHPPFDPSDEVRPIVVAPAETHPLGRGAVRAGNAAIDGDRAALTLAAGAYDGAEVVSDARHGHGTYAARLRTPLAPGSISAFFLYQGIPGDNNDEIDVEILNDGSRRVLFTTWVAGGQTGPVTMDLPFDPADDFHLYTIEWRADAVRFGVDGRVMHAFRHGIPVNPMFVMANAWWPTWLHGPVLQSPRTLEIERITTG